MIRQSNHISLVDQVNPHGQSTHTLNNVCAFQLKVIHAIEKVESGEVRGHTT